MEGQVSCDLTTEGRTCGAWQIREPGYTCSQHPRGFKSELLLAFQARRFQYYLMKVAFS